MQHSLHAYAFFISCLWNFCFMPMEILFPAYGIDASTATRLRKTKNGIRCHTGCRPSCILFKSQTSITEQFFLCQLLDRAIL